MPHVFISYKREDFAFVQTLVQKLREADIDSWTDAQIQAGENWRTTIDERIKDAFALLVVMSPEAKVSEYVTYEWSLAMGHDTPILPVKLRTTEMHPKLAELQWIDCTIPYGEPWTEIVARLRAILEQSQISPSMKAALAALDHWYHGNRLRGIEVVVISKQAMDGVHSSRRATKKPVADSERNGRIGVYSKRDQRVIGTEEAQASTKSMSKHGCHSRMISPLVASS